MVIDPILTSEINMVSTKDIWRHSAWTMRTSDCLEMTFLFLSHNQCRSWTWTHQQPWRNCCCWWSSRGTDELTGAQEGRDVEEIEHYEEKPRRPKFNWIMRKSGSQCVDAGGGVGLYILNFEEGNEVDCEEETTKLSQGVADGGMRKGGDRRVSTEQAVLCSSSLFKSTLFFVQTHRLR